VLCQEGKVARHLEVEIVADDVPQVGVDGPGVLGAHVAGVGIDVELDEAQGRLVGAHDLQRSPAGGDEVGIPGGHCPQEGDHAVARPDLRIAGRQGGGAKALGRDRAAEDVEGAFSASLYE